ncbi:MAG: NAD(P)H-dependent oxidoreductase [Cellvibrionaceae bacterium]
MSNKILFLAGSARKDSMNKKLAKQAFELAKEKGAEVTWLDLADYKMPIYDGDLESESGLPESAIKLKEIFAEHKGLFIASPEYNGSFSSLLKNTLDWISRPHQENEEGLKAYTGKVAALASTSPGSLGGLRGLVPLRMLLGNIQVTVLPNQLAVPFYGKSFDESGHLVDDNFLSALHSVVDQLIAAVR